MGPDQLKRLRAKLGLSQTALAETLRLGSGGKRTVARWEAGAAIPGPATVALEALESGWCPGDEDWQDLRQHYLQCLDEIQEVVTQARDRVGKVTRDANAPPRSRRSPE